MKVLWTRLALLDLNEVYAYIHEEKPSATSRMLAQIKKTTQNLARHPEIGRPGRVNDTREIIVTGTPLIIAYRLKANRVELIALIPGARRWPDQF